MVTVEKAILLWKSVDKTNSITQQGVDFHRLISETSPTAKVPSKTSRLRSRIVTTIGAIERIRNRSGDKETAVYLKSWFLKAKKTKKVCVYVYVLTLIINFSIRMNTFICVGCVGDNM